MNAVDHRITLIGWISESAREPDTHVQSSARRKGLIDDCKTAASERLFQDAACHSLFIGRRPVIEVSLQLIEFFYES